MSYLIHVDHFDAALPWAWMLSLMNHEPRKTYFMSGASLFTSLSTVFFFILSTSADVTFSLYAFFPQFTFQQITCLFVLFRVKLNSNSKQIFHLS